MPLLAHRDLGGKGHPPLVILHGLLGSSRNWQSAGRDLALLCQGSGGRAGAFHVLALDLRNHGDSFHAREMDYGTMAGDVIAWLDARGLQQAHVIGHSMGGKVAMVLACRHPERVGRLVIVDIAPKAYPKSHGREFDAMNALDLSGLASRSDAEKAMEPFVPDGPMRQFLLSNLERRPQGGFCWTINLAGLTEAVPTLEATFLEPNERWNGETLFVLGGKSRYFLPGDEAKVAPHFPRARFVTIDESGHNPHFETREKFVGVVKEFLEAG